MRLGKTWTMLIVAQVAVAVAVLPVALFTAWEMSTSETLGGGATAPELLTARLSLSEESMPPGTPADPAATAAIVADRQAELVRRLVSEPGIADVVLVSPLPGDDLPASVETEPLVPDVEPAREVARYSRVEPKPPHPLSPSRELGSERWAEKRSMVRDRRRGQRLPAHAPRLGPG
jgi:hypothetical protein